MTPVLSIGTRTLDTGLSKKKPGKKKTSWPLVGNEGSFIPDIPM